MYYWGLVILLVLADQTIKWWAASNLQLGDTITLIPGWLDLTNVHNDGAAWSMLEGLHTFFILIAIVAVGVILWLMKRNWRQTGKMIALSLLLAGTIGNFIDRFAQSYVVDMFELTFINFPIFNLADTCLTIGVLIYIVIILRED